MYTPLYDIYEELSKLERYKGYMHDVKQFISPYHRQKRPLEMVRKYSESVGLIIEHLEIREKVFIYENDAHLKGKLCI